jgi:hypothetical protein
MATPKNHRSFEISNMGNCVLYFFETLDDCELDEDFIMMYDAMDQNLCIPPRFAWGAFQVLGC